MRLVAQPSSDKQQNMALPKYDMSTLAYDAGSNAKLAAINQAMRSMTRLASPAGRVPPTNGFQTVVFLDAFGLSRPPGEACDRSL